MNLADRLNSWMSHSASLAALMVLAGAIGGCGSSPSATAKYCNGLQESGQGFNGYMSFVGDGANGTWTAYSGTCTPCQKIPSGKSLDIESGDETSWFVRFTTTLDNGGQYMFVAEMNGSQPDLTQYHAKSGYTCQDISPP
jgi:hypothetical protein